MIRSFAPYGARGASSRVRLYDWFDFLGWDVERHDYLGLANNSVRSLARRPAQVLRAEWALRQRRAPSDVTIISREASPLSNGHLEARLMRGSGRGVFDFDDAIYLGGGHLRNFINQERKARRAVEAADVVIVGNQVLAEWASAYSTQVEVIPSCVDPSDYEQKHDYEIQDVPRLIWVGSPSTEKYLAEIGHALDALHRKTGAVVIAISGPPVASSPLDEWPAAIQRVGWEPNLVGRLLLSADVALAPLPSNPYTKGKCAYKLLQYAAAGLPVVGAPVGANAQALALFNGIAVDSSDDWGDALESVLTESADTRSQRGRAGISAVNKHYSFEAWQERWSAAVVGASQTPPLTAQ